MTTSVAFLGLTLLSASSTDLPSASNYEEPYCGLYCMYAALNTLGLKPDFDRMNDSSYLSGRNGSTGADLVNLASSQGSTGTFCPNLTVADLRESRYPIVLHANVPASKMTFHHWILFVGWAEDAVRVYDPPQGQYTLSQAELLSHWDGIGVVIGKPEAKWEMPAANPEIILAFLLVAASGGVVLRFLHLARHPALGILFTSIVSALAWHATVGYGFVGNRFALDNIATSYQEAHVSTITFDEFNQLVGRKGVTVVDARMPSGYNRSHVPGAISIPIAVTHGSLREALATIPVDNQIVVYCESEECGWAGEVANLFPAGRYRRVTVYPGGMKAWREATARNTQRGSGAPTNASHRSASTE